MICMFVYMKSIPVKPDNPEQLKATKATLNVPQVQLESAQSDYLPVHISKSIQRGISQIENGQSISLEEFTQRHLSE